MRPRHRVALAAPLAAALALAACQDGAGLDPAAERGRQVYLGQCTACHASDPAQRGSVGPPVKGSSRPLLEARVLHGTYPPGYAPKQNTRIMQPMPQLAGSLDDLAAYLR
jgi:mono/diheme cytochrome c family protein